LSRCAEFLHLARLTAGRTFSAPQYLKSTGTSSPAGRSCTATWDGRSSAERRKLEGDALANEKRIAYIDVLAIFMFPLEGKDFKVARAADERDGDKPTATVILTEPYGKDFTM
jgi:hypothetical protein